MIQTVVIDEGRQFQIHLIQLLENPIPAPAALRHKNRHMAISWEPRELS